MNDETEKLSRLIKNARRTVFFGGAGVATESGIPDFRSVDGLYSQKYKYPPETVLHHDFFVGHTEEFYDFYRDRMIYDGAKPNFAHLKLAELEANGKLTAIVTQNIDGLHQSAGSRNVYELHGSIHRNFCTRCKKFFPLSFIKQSKGIPRCDCGGIIKPDVVLYGEQLDSGVVNGALGGIMSGDLLIVGGTSLTVYPAAGFLKYFGGDELVLINRDATAFDGAASLVIREPIAKVFERIKL